ncbi:ribose 5-phosphate isomerase B [Ferrimicrobium sp.]|uniref:ribose 5-phosphate isomerase B n=1 Tax=Ferrimicrobium sp. TaxID=2926050 RepID=UPI0026101D43|nr:ribose 5-phosphate isomerase B [Ferrimicrobium sp.]
MNLALDGVVVAIGGDHAGFPLKGKVAQYLEDEGAVVIDFGTDSEESVDYPLYCEPVGRAVASGVATLGVVLGGSGQGEQIVANKVVGVRAALCWNELSARLARAHNDANVLALGARLLGDELALAIVAAFVSGVFDGGRHERRIAQIHQVEEGVSFVQDASR